MSKRERVRTFDKTMTLEEAEEEKRKQTPTGRSLRQADREYDERRRR